MSHRINNVPAMVPMTIPAIAPPDMQLQDFEPSAARESSCEGFSRGRYILEGGIEEDETTIWGFEWFRRVEDFGGSSRGFCMMWYAVSMRSVE